MPIPNQFEIESLKTLKLPSTPNSQDNACFVMQEHSATAWSLLCDPTSRILDWIKSYLNNQLVVIKFHVSHSAISDEFVLLKGNVFIYPRTLSSKLNCKWIKYTKWSTCIMYVKVGKKHHKTRLWIFSNLLYEVDQNFKIIFNSFPTPSKSQFLYFSKSLKSSMRLTWPLGLLCSVQAITCTHALFTSELWAKSPAWDLSE